MSQPSSVKSFDGSSPTPDLQPGLKVALGSMDVELEAELARYRRQSKKAKPFASVSPPEIPEGKFQVPPSNLVANSQPPVATPPTSIASSPLPAEPEISTTTVGVDSSTTTPGANNSIPKDYLDSSEELLRSADEPDVVPSATPKQNAWRSPLGIGLVILFLLSAATLGYVVFNPGRSKNGTPSPAASQPQNSTGSRKAELSSSETDTAGTMPSGPDLASQEFKDLDLNSLSSADPSPEPIPSPIAAPTATPTSAPESSTPSETVDSLNNLNSVLSQPPLPEKPDTTAEAQPTPTSSPSSSPSASSSPSPDASPSPEASPSETETTVTLPDPIVNDDYYGFYFVVLNADAKLWEKATAAVPDAYNRAFPVGDRIQMGAFEDREDAEKLVEILKEQDLSAEIYQPD